MSVKINTYSFLPWLRQGIANNIKTQDLDSSIKVRAGVNVSLTLRGEGIDTTETETISKDVAIYGPGDIIGIQSKAVIKTEPHNWITNFEPNYLPYIDFYDEDFPWRYTPAAPNNALGRLRPWIILVVLREDEFKDGKNIAGKPLPYIEVPDASNVFPQAEQLWAWAHVHINEDIVKLDDDIETNDLNSVLPRFREVLKENPDLAYSRIICPRKLDANTAYHAFLIPVFESGRLAGLGLNPEEKLNAIAELHATYSAWQTYAEKSEFEPESYPYYYRWYFRTGTVGDFEYLVRLLEPRPIDSRVGRRDIDVQEPGSNIDGIKDEALGGVLKLGGALKLPFDSLNEEEQADVIKYDNWAEPYPHRFQRDVAAFINLSDDYSKKKPADANRDTEIPKIKEDQDPLITPPLYGRWHAMVQRLLEESDRTLTVPNKNWIHELNLDPRWRVSAGIGTKVVQDKQEEFMDSAWGQVGDVLEANRKIRLARLAKATSSVFYNKHIVAMKERGFEKVMGFTAPLQKRVLAKGSTIFYRVNTSRISHAAVSTPMRRIVRPRSRLMRLLPFDDNIRPDNLFDRINKEDVHSAPPKEVPKTVPTLDDISGALKPKNVPRFILELLSKYPWLQYLSLVLAGVLLIALLVLGLVGLWRTILVSIIILSVYLFTLLRKWTRQVQEAESVLEKNQTRAAVDNLPKSPNFRISDIHEGFEPSMGYTDAPEAIRYKNALRDTYGFVQVSGQVGEIPHFGDLNINVIVNETLNGIDPELTIPRLVLNDIQIPKEIKEFISEEFNEVMAYPEINIPMYKPLLDISAELFLPNINYVAQNSISLVETNQKFIESYMVGLNHEFARELLWREYPTDQRGTYFRQFWDVSGYLSAEPLDDEALKERLRDIPPLHRWSRLSNLGDHDYREEQGDKEEETVLVIRGELLKKYPTAVIYAHRAEWQRKKDGTIDNTKERLLVPLTEGELNNPPRYKVKTPLYEAKSDPDIYFFGFDITIREAKGGTGEDPQDDPGWFFVVKERPGEPRFGLDLKRDGDLNVWNDLAWEDVMPGAAPNAFISINPSMTAITLNDPHCDPSDPLHNPELEEKCSQYDEDMHLTWNKNMNAAEVAYILFQVPVLVAIHASEMLPKDKT
jgi:hypothetical protein